MVADWIHEAMNSLVASLDECLTREDVENASGLIDAGEPGLALELLCTQVHEYDAVVSPAVWELMRCAGRAMGVSERYWSLLSTGP